MKFNKSFTCSGKYLYIYRKYIESKAKVKFINNEKEEHDYGRLLFELSEEDVILINDRIKDATFQE